MAGTKTARRRRPAGQAAGSCCVESFVSVDARGQMVLPKEVRRLAGVKAGDRLAVVVWRQGKAHCCLCLFKADALAAMTRRLLGPMVKDLSGPRRG